jgi:hypothetical protein
MQKRLIIGIAGSDGKEFKDIAILPNTRAIDVLKQLNLRGFQLAKPEGGMMLSEARAREHLVQRFVPPPTAAAQSAD